MKRAIFALACLGLWGCGGVGGGDNLLPNQGGVFNIIEMPAAGTDEVISQIQVRVFDLAGNEIAPALQFAGAALDLETGRWPQATGTCVPLKANLVDADDSFLSSNSSCITFTLVKNFDVDDVTDDELTVSMQISALDANGVVRASAVHSVVIRRGQFLGDPNVVTTVDQLAPYIATLFVPD